MLAWITDRTLTALVRPCRSREHQVGILEELQTPLPSGGRLRGGDRANVFRVFERDRLECFFETGEPRVYATVPAEVTLHDLNGMSGGPLFAFTRGRDSLIGLL
jgi:hypothetical protein